MEKQRASKRRVLERRFGNVDEIIRTQLNGNVDNLIGITKDNQLVTRKG